MLAATGLSRLAGSHDAPRSAEEAWFYFFWTVWRRVAGLHQAGDRTNARSGSAPVVPIAHDDSDMVRATAYNPLAHVTPEELDQLSTNGACGKQQAEPEGGTVLDASSAQG